MDRAVTGKTFCYLTYGSRTANRTESLYQIVNGLVGNVDWGESLTIAACEFQGLNTDLTPQLDQSPRKHVHHFQRTIQDHYQREGML